MEKYFVCSDGTIPISIKFSLEEAKAVGANYIDVFDENGIHCGFYENINGLYERSEIVLWDQELTSEICKE